MYQINLAFRSLTRIFVGKIESYERNQMGVHWLW